MAKEKAVASTSLIQELSHAGRYKRTQGKVARQLTMVAIWLVVGVLSWNLYEGLIDKGRGIQLMASGVVLFVGFWLGFRVVNWPRFADFLIAVEAEMNKVTWPSRGELKRSSTVVIVLVFSMATLLFSFDFVWRTVFAKETWRWIFSFLA